MTGIKRALLLVIVIAFVAACGPQRGPAEGLRLTAPPRGTATPISTALPSVATGIPAGLPDNPLIFTILPQDIAEAERLERRLEESLLFASNVTIDVQLVENFSQALQSLCNSNQGIVTAAWVDGLTYAAAVGQNCGTPVLQLQLGEGRRATTGESGVIVMDSRLATTELSALIDRTFCRLAFDDFFSWILPNLMLRAAEVSTNDFSEVLEFDSYTELLEAVAAGECAGTGVPADVWEEWEEDATDAYEEAQRRAAEATPEPEEDADPDADPTPEPVDGIGVELATTSVEFPFGVLLLPFETPLAARLALIDGLEALEADDFVVEITPEPEPVAESTGEAEPEVTPDPENTPEVEIEVVNLLLLYFGEGLFVRVETDDFDEVNAFLAETGLDFSQLGE